MAGRYDGAHDREGEQRNHVSDHAGIIRLATEREVRSGRSGAVELAARENAIPPPSSARDSAASDQANQAARRSILPTPRSWTFAPSVSTNPIYTTTVSQALRARPSGNLTDKI